MSIDLSYPKDIPTLTSLRFFAAMLVVFHHFGYYLPFDMTEHTWLLKRGALAVDFFFILSGFILTHAYSDGLLNQKISFRHFITRRFSRIYPLHALMLLVMAVLAVVGLGFGQIGRWDGSFSVWSFFANITLVHAWGLDKGLTFNVPSWSISAEWFAYLTFPLLLIYLVRLTPAKGLFLAFIFMIGLWLFFDAMMPRVTTRLTFDCAIFRIIPEFVLGSALYLFSRTVQPVRRPGWWLLVSAILVFPLLHFNVADFLILPVFSVMIVAAADLSRTGYKGWLSQKNWVFWGDASYAIYMTHYVFMTAILTGAYIWGGGIFYGKFYPALFTIVLVLTLGASALLFQCFETPIRGWLTSKLDTLGK
ncbi:MAG: acyltransferase family protein [Micavibrio sp.]